MSAFNLNMFYMSLLCGKNYQTELDILKNPWFDGYTRQNKPETQLTNIFIL